jgi:tetratricopeptide (TPR) repeat protein
VTQTPAAASEARTGEPEALQDASDLKSVGFLSLQGGQKLMTDAGSAVAAGNYTQAIKKLQEARQVFNQLSNFYQEIGSSFSGVDNRIADDLRKKALDAAQMRDEATYQLALAHRAQNQPELSVPLLVQIIRSQNPTRDLGKKAYNQLVELGFADTPFPRPAQPQQ